MRFRIDALLAVLLAGPALADGPTSTPAVTRSFDLAALDRAVDPCSDFFEFACGSWRKSNPIPGDRSRWGRFDALAEANLNVLHEILEKAADPEAKRSPVDVQVGDYYAACMDEAAAEKKGAAPLGDLFARIEAVKTRADLTGVVAELHSYLIPAMFSFYPSPSLKDSSLTVANVDQGGIGLPDRDDYFKTDPKAVERREKYVEHVGKMFQLLGGEPEDAAAHAKTVMAIETELARGYLDRVARRDPKNRDNMLARAALLELAPSFDLARYFEAIKAPAFTDVNVANLGFYKSVNLDQFPLADWKTYLRWRVLRAAAPGLSSAFVDESFRFGEAYLRGTKELEARWKRCVRRVDGELGEALGRLFVEKTFGEEGRARMAQMVAALNKSMDKNVRGLAWMTDATKTRALEKLAAFGTSKVGAPEKYRDYSSVVVSRDDFVGNVRRANAFEARRQLVKIGQPVDRTEWRMSPPTVNAYYSPPNTEIVFPAGILQPPFFDRTIDDPVNFGGIGAVIGHEYSHGFDDQGRKFDATGALKDWWTEEDAKAFEERAACFVDEYGSFVAVKDPKTGEEVKLNGRLTLGENTADNGGVRIAYGALKEALGAKTPAPKDGFTWDQRFFIGYAQVWCQNVTDDESRLRAQTDTHSPGRYRVNGVLGNMPEFQQAFSCPAGQPMVREKACRVW